MSTIQVGSILIENRPLILRALGLESESYSERWSVLQSSTNSTLDNKIRAAGWNCAFMAVEVKATAFGALAAGSVRRALQKIFVMARTPDFNCLEIIKIVENRFLGMPYITVSAHTRHIQQGSIMKLMDEHENSQTVLQ